MFEDNRIKNTTRLVHFVLPRSDELNAMSPDIYRCTKPRKKKH